MLKCMLTFFSVIGIYFGTIIALWILIRTVLLLIQVLFYKNEKVSKILNLFVIIVPLFSILGGATISYFLLFR